MIDSVATGLLILDSETRIQTDAGLVKITDLEGSAGPQGPPGPEGPQGTPADTSLFYSKSEVDIRLLFKENTLNTHVSDGAKVFDTSQRLMRNIFGRNGIQTFIYMNPQDGADTLNDSIVIDGSALQGGAGVNPNVATFSDSNAVDAIDLKKPTTCRLGLDVVNGLIVDQLNTTQLTTSSLTSSGLTVQNNASVAGNLSAGAFLCGGSCEVNGQFHCTGALPNTNDIVSARCFSGSCPRFRSEASI